MSILDFLHNQVDHCRKHVVALGNFDGVHIAHQEIVKQCVIMGKALGQPVVILTFHPHPVQILHPERGLKLLTTPEEKLALLKDLGVDQVLQVPFSAELAKITARDFVSEVLVSQLNVSYIVSGHNFHFGYKRQGDPEFLMLAAREYNFCYFSINQIYVEYETVSSSNIRSLLKMGAVNIVSNLLGRRYAIRGQVAKGAGRGKGVGYHTANIALVEGIRYPCYGVYLIRAILGQSKLWGVANIGIRPSFGASELVLEVHLFDICTDMYGCEVTIEFWHFLRPERKFANSTLLAKQIKTDIADAKFVLAQLSSLEYGY